MGAGISGADFDGDFEVIDARVVGGKHLKLRIEPLHGQAVGTGARSAVRGVDAIAFGHLDGTTDDAAVRPRERLQVAYRLEVNEYRGAESVQLNCQHLKPV